jgi:uncharacterized membrane protein YciS (DUF1049 family)
MNVILFCAGLIVGIALMAYAALQERRELVERHTKELERLNNELALKQNVLESQNERICVQRREIERLHNNHKPFKL